MPTHLDTYTHIASARTRAHAHIDTCGQALHGLLRVLGGASSAAHQSQSPRWVLASWVLGSPVQGVLSWGSRGSSRSSGDPRELLRGSSLVSPGGRTRPDSLILRRYPRRSWRHPERFSSHSQEESGIPFHWRRYCLLLRTSRWSRTRSTSYSTWPSTNFRGDGGGDNR